jgi:hypothetical protein
MHSLNGVGGAAGDMVLGARVESDCGLSLGNIVGRRVVMETGFDEGNLVGVDDGCLVIGVDVGLIVGAPEDGKLVSAMHDPGLILLESNVTAPFNACAVPMRLAPVVIVILVTDITPPMNAESVPNVAELPISQRISQEDPT